MAQFKSIGRHPLFPGFKEAFVTEDGFLFSEDYGGPRPYGKFLKEWVAKEDDVYVVGYYKTAQTWMQEIVSLITSDVNFKWVEEEMLPMRTPMLDTDLLFDFEKKMLVKSPRVYRCPYPYQMLPQTIIDNKSRIIYTMRNPKDTMVSCYQNAKWIDDFAFTGECHEYFDAFLKGDVWGGSFAKHVLSYWEKRNLDNILIVSYEEMKKDLAAIIRKVASFLGKSLTEEEVTKASAHCSFENMKKSPKTNFNLIAPLFNPDPAAVAKSKISRAWMRKGEVGDWKNYFTEDMNKQIEEYVKENFDGTGVTFTYEL